MIIDRSTGGGEYDNDNYEDVSYHYQHHHNDDYEDAYYDEINSVDMMSKE